MSHQGNYPADLAEMSAWVVGRVPPGGRVLEIGSGDGAMTRSLADSGIDVVGIDPDAAPDSGVLEISLEDFEAEPFDVIFASVSLHHLPEPDRTVAALRRLSRAGTVAVVREFDRVLLDHEPTLRWWYHQRRAFEVVADDPDDHPLPATFGEFYEMWRERMEHHVLPWEAVLKLLGEAGFEAESTAPAPYLFRWGLYDELRPLEERLIAEGRIRQIGVHWTGRRTA